MKVDVERERLEKEAEELALTEMTPEIEQRLDEVYHRLDEMGSDMAEARAASILHGLGFDRDMQQKKCRDFSGGWRMRISLARALYINPTFLILDEPTNHLDLEACVWLEEKLKRFNKILLMVSHSQDFLNNVCTNIIHMQGKKCHYYSGNYDQFLVTKMELDENQMKRYKWEQNQIADMKNYIARFGHGSAKLARQAQSKEKVLQKMIAGGLTEQVSSDRGEWRRTAAWISPRPCHVGHLSACALCPDPAVKMLRMRGCEGPRRYGGARVRCRGAELGGVRVGWDPSVVG